MRRAGAVQAGLFGPPPAGRTTGDGLMSPLVPADRGIRVREQAPDRTSRVPQSSRPRLETFPRRIARVSLFAMSVRRDKIGVGKAAPDAPVTVAIALPSNPWIREEAVARGWRLVHMRHLFFHLPAQAAPRGALVDLVPDDDRVRRLLRRGCRVVRLGHFPHPDDDRVPAVLPDHEAEGRMAADYFAERGFRHVGYVGSDPWSEMRVLYEAFRARAIERGMFCHLHRFKTGASGEGFSQTAPLKERGFKAWLRGVPKPFGLLAYNDVRASVFAAWTVHAGFRVPADVAILSRGKSPEICEWNMPSLSCLDLYEERRVRTACDLLARLMAGEPGPKTPILVPPRGVITRESTDALGAPDPIVRAAVDFLWTHLERDLSVDDVAEAVGVPLHRLKRAFHEHLGRGVAAEMLRRRLEVLRDLLCKEKTPVADLALRVGFRNLAHLHRQFRRAYGVSPARYRKEHRGR